MNNIVHKGKKQGLRVLSYNCGLLRVRFPPFKVTLFTNPPFVDERFSYLSEKLLESNADILALQEIYEGGHAAHLVDRLQYLYPYYHRDTCSNKWQLHNGLMFFSKYPIKKGHLIKHNRSALLEKCFGSKCMQSVEVCSPIGNILFLNLHFTAGGYSHPDSEKINEIRESEVLEAIKAGEDFATREKESAGEINPKVVILGDLNCGPDASPMNYDLLKSNGYIDGALKYIFKEDSKKDNFSTWCPRNKLNARGVHRHLPPARIDHLFVKEGSNLEVTDLTIKLTEHFVPTDTLGNVTLSDHYAIDALLEVHTPSLNPI